MGARGEAAAATRERILDAALELFWERPGERASLEQIAARAGVTVQTVIRRFGGRAGLFAAASEREAERVRIQRDEAPVGDVRGAVRVLVEHYEQLGDRIGRLLAEEHRIPGLSELADAGRAFHRRWCARVFAPSLDALSGVARERRLAQLVAICDFYTWRLLRRDSALSRRQTELALLEMLEAILAEER